MSDDSPEDLDLQQIVEALLNICGQAAEQQLDEASRQAIYEMCDAVAQHHGIPRWDAIVEEQEDGSHRVTYYGEVDADTQRPKTGLRLVVDNDLEDEDDDSKTIH